MAYVQLPMVVVSVEDLRLDLENYRIPSRPDDEAAALNYLFAEEDVLGAARVILRDGYFDNEVPIVVEEFGSFVVLEGNRRVSALKGLLSPNSVPTHADELSELRKRYAVEADDLPSAIRVLVAPTREAANPHIARLHTTVPKRRWTRDQQATYYYSLFLAGTDVASIKADYPDVDVVRFIRMAEMRRFLRGATFADGSLRDYVASSRLKMSSFEFAYRNVDIAAAIGVVFDSEGHLVPSIKRPEAIGADLSVEHRTALEFLMTEFRAGRLNTRSEEFKKKAPEHAALLRRLTLDPDLQSSASVDQESDGPEASPANDADQGGSGPSTSGEDSGRRGRPSGGGEDAEPSPSPRGPNHPDTSNRIQLGSLDYSSTTSPNLQRRYHELRKVNIAETPVAAALLLRSILESTIKEHFEGTANAVSGELKVQMDQVHQVYAGNRTIQAAINKIRSAGVQSPGSIKWFNAAAHSADHIIQAQEVRLAVGLLHPLLRHLLRRPE